MILPEYMNVTDRVKFRVALNMCNDDEFKIDPMTILLITNIVIEIIKLVHECRQEENREIETLRHPSAGDRRILKWVVRRKLGFFKYWRDRRAYIKALEKVGKDLTKFELNRMYKENGLES